MSARRSAVLDATIFAATGIAILIGLGIWQLDRKAWKEDLMEKTGARLAAAPANLPPREQWARLDQATNEFRRVTFPAEFL
ncbi:MAG: SURF1 family cytochrome oxidase biogenesis protein, partial [Pseudolabrys sp.]